MVGQIGSGVKFKWTSRITKRPSYEIQCVVHDYSFRNDEPKTLPVASVTMLALSLSVAQTTPPIKETDQQLSDV